MTKNQKLYKINAKWRRECKCELRKTALQAVPGNGNANAQIVFIGEAPGRNEDKEGLPFVGAAGKFLASMLSSIKLTREDVYITNIVKYRPPNNRDPLPSEKEACRKWLNEELEVLKPKLIVLLGRHALNDFFPALKIGKAHGKLLEKKLPGISTKYFYALYHPALALYDGSMRQTLLADFKKIPKILLDISKRKPNAKSK
jgi:uracil-DNA glycosylase family 4